jgi:alkylation response protein AidB-like acyl-CoA dehydrogenase
MDQKEIEVRPIRQMTGTSEFNEVFFDGAKTKAEYIVGAPGEGWKVAMGTLSFERGVSTIGQQLHFFNELKELVAIAIKNGASRNAVLRQRLAQAWARLAIMRYNTLRVLSDGQKTSLPPEAMISKLYWSEYHRDFGKLAMDVLGPASELLEGEGYALSRLQSTYLFSRADTIYAGTSEIQRNIIAQRALGMPRPPRG